MLTAKQAKALSDKTAQKLKDQEADKALEDLSKILPDILRRIEEEANRTNKASHSIDITNIEYHYICKTLVLQSLGYQVLRSINPPWKTSISWG